MYLPYLNLQVSAEMQMGTMIVKHSILLRMCNDDNLGQNLFQLGYEALIEGANREL